MKIKFFDQTIIHKRKIPRTPIVNQTPYFGTFGDGGKVLTYNEAMYIYHKIQDFLDKWDVETEIDYRESEGEFTKEEAAKLRKEMKEITEDYRGALDDDGHWNDVLMDILNERKREL